MGFRNSPLTTPRISDPDGATTSSSINTSGKTLAHCRPATMDENGDLLKLAPKKKRVRFSHDEDSGALTTTEQDSDIFRDQLHKSSLWWTKHERENILSDCRDAIMSFCTDCDDQVQHYVDVFDRCCDSLSPSSSDYIETATVALPTTIRGLEWGFAPETKKRRQHVVGVLEVQERVQSLNPQMRDKLLSSQSLRSSRCCLLIARLLGEGDRVSLQEGTRKRRYCEMGDRS